jgi:L-ascorbate oxidase
MVSQWPIAPYHYFDYEIRPEIGDAGTYFYHSHVGFQAVTAHGILIVHAAKDAMPPYAYDGDIPVLLSDYYQRNDSDIEAGLLANPFKWAGEPLAIGLNGRTGNASFSNATDDSCKPYVINVEPGKTYRLRFIGATAISFIMFGIESHTELDVIEADGHYTKPVSTDHIQIATGQRFSVLLRTKTLEQLNAENRTSYWIRYESRDRPTNVTGYALLQYTGNGTNTFPDDLPSSPPVQLSQNRTEYNTWLEYTLESLNSTENDLFPRASEVTRTVHIRVNQGVVDGFYNGSVQGMLQWL